MMHIIATIILYLLLLGVAILCYISFSKCFRDIEGILDYTARTSRVLAEHEQKFETLEANAPTEIIPTEDDKKERKADLDYNEGMNNIFGYSVNSGIKVGDDIGQY